MLQVPLRKDGIQSLVQAVLIAMAKAGNAERNQAGTPFFLWSEPRHTAITRLYQFNFRNRFRVLCQHFNTSTYRLQVVVMNGATPHALYT